MLSTTPWGGAIDQSRDCEEVSPEESKDPDFSSHEVEPTTTTRLQNYQNILQLTLFYPSSSMKDHNLHLNWLRVPACPGKLRGSPLHLLYVKDVSSALRSISNFFHRQSTPSDFHLTDVNPKVKEFKPYFSDFLDGLKEKDNEYIKLFKVSRIKTPMIVNRSERKHICELVYKMMIYYKASEDTFHTAIFLLNAYSHFAECSRLGLELAAITSLWIAMKLEEKNDKVPSVAKFIRLTPSAKKISGKDVVWMEKEILSMLSFKILPPSAKHFIDIAVNSGSLRFKSDSIKNTVLQITRRILLRQLMLHDFMCIPNSLKAEAALLVVTEPEEILRSEYAKPVMQAESYCFKSFYAYIQRLQENSNLLRKEF